MTETVTLTEEEYGALTAAGTLWVWPWPCHREGHIFEVGNGRCIYCKARQDWDSMEDILATAKRRFRDKRREELPNYFTLPSGLLLDLS